MATALKRTIISIILFSASVLLLTRLDFLINNELYGFGLQFSQEWYSSYSVLLSLTYQLGILLIVLITRSFVFLAMSEAFVLSNTPDLIYFGLWQRSFPNGNWTWMGYYHTFGVYTTQTQIVLTTFALTLGTITSLAYLLIRKRLSLNKRENLVGNIL